MYNIIPQSIPRERRAELNGKILQSIEAKHTQLTGEMVYNIYSGIGGLHGLDRKDFDNYHQYAQAKREAEMGQFFTPHHVCRQMVAMADPQPGEEIADLSCGMGNFFNFLTDQQNAYGIDIDENAVAVAKYLYPKANIEHCDIRKYDPGARFDIVLGNPPFNLNWGGTLSQFYYCTKAAKLLNPAGLMVIIVPQTFLSDEFAEKRRIAAIDRDFSFIGQMKLPPDAFKSVGVSDFGTKVVAFMRRSNHIKHNPYNPEEYISGDELRGRIAGARYLKQRLRLHIGREANRTGETQANERFEYKLRKYLYELKNQSGLQKHHPEALALVEKYRTQKPPEECTAEEFSFWERNVKIQPEDVLTQLRRTIRSQNYVPRDEIAIIRTRYSYKLKEYAPRLLEGAARREVKMYDLVAHEATLPRPPQMTPENERQYRSAMKVIDRKRRELDIQIQPFGDMEPDRALDEYIATLTFLNDKMRECRFTPLQCFDMGRIFHSRYGLLNWQQGSGKTAVAYHYGKYQLIQNRVKNTVILAPSIAIQMTWEPFLERQGERFVTIHRPEELQTVPQGVFVLVSLSILERLYTGLRRWMKLCSNKICLLFDESDEITNHEAGRTIKTLAIFRRAHSKLLATGTTARNNVTELYPQLELMYNNSANMMCYSTETYYQDKETGEIFSENNTCYSQPYPANGGAALFKASFCPAKTTVFGIEKQNQDIYNQDELSRIISYSIITRKFREFAGDKFTIHTHKVTPSQGEWEVYKAILQQFCRLYERFFRKTTARKESALKLVRQIQLLIKACSVPTLFGDYFGEEYPRKLKFIAGMIESMPGTVAIGCTNKEAVRMYADYLSRRFPMRPVFVIRGEIPFKKRRKIVEQFEASIGGILVCTQQSLRSSANIPSCNEVIIESLQWNIPRMEQFYFRFIRLDSEGNTRVHFITYEGSIEQNILALVLTKERLNEFIKSGEVREQSDIFEEFDISPSLIDELLKREQDDEGKFYISWGQQKVS